MGRLERMPESAPEKQLPFSKPLEFLQKVKYGGAVGKQAVIAVVALIVLGIAILSLWGQMTAVLAIVIVVFAVFVISLASIHKTLQKHPELALMDGTEIIAYKKLEMTAKSMKIEPGPLMGRPENPPPPPDGESR